MKFKCLLLILSLCVTQAQAVDETFDSLKIGDRLVKNVRVTKSTPVDVTLTFDGGGAVIKRQELPAELKAKYPYDAKEAADFESAQAKVQSQKATEARAKQAASASSIKATLLLKEREIRTRLEPLQTELKRTEREKDTQVRIAKGKGAKSQERRKADALRAQCVNLREKIAKIQDELQKVQVEISKY